MKLYFNRDKEQFSKLEHSSHLAYMGGFVSMMFGFFEARHAQSIMGLFFAVAALTEIILLYKQGKEEQKINIYNILRLFACLTLTVIAFTCFEKIFG